VVSDFIGSGWSFPLRTNAAGGIALVSGDAELEGSIRLILGTAYGERPMRPEFGCGIHEYAFAPADATTAGRIAFEVNAALGRWEPRIEVEQVDVTIDPDREGTLLIDIGYRVRGDNDVRNLVFPFYTIPDERDPADDVVDLRLPEGLL
jgi:uncharacterized protein